MSKENPLSNRKRNKLLDMSKINEFHIDLASINADIVIDILKKQPFERELKDYSILNDYILFVSKLTEKFRSQKIPQSLYEKMILLSLSSCKLKVFLSSNNQIYTPETEANYIYIVLKGSVKIIKVQKQLIKMNSFNYFQMLINLRNKKEDYLLKNTINENNGIFPVDYAQVDFLDKILLKILLINRKEVENDYDYLDRLIKTVGLKYEDFNLTCSYREQLQQKNDQIQSDNYDLIKLGKGAECKELIPYNVKEAEEYVMEQEKKIFDELSFISYDVCQKYIFFTFDKEEYITKYELVPDKIIKVNEYFGENFGNKYIDFTEANEDNLYLLMIKNNMINEIIDKEMDKVTTNQRDFFVNNFFFRSVKKNIFERYYLNFFVLENYLPGQKICEENESVKYLYFIKKGRVRLSYKKSILEVHSLINIIKESIKQKRFEGENNENEESEIIKFLENEQNYYNLNGDIEKIKPELNNKQERNIMIYQENQCIGYESYYYGLKYLYTAKAVSDSVEIYKISITQLAKIFNNKNEKCYIDLSKKAEETLFFFMKRFIKINNFLLNFLEKRREAEEIEKNASSNQFLNRVNPRNIFDKNNYRKGILIKKSEISRILPDVIKRIKSQKTTENSYLLNNESSFVYKKLPILNINESSNQSDNEKNFNNDKGQLPKIENDKCHNLKKQLFYKKLNNNKKPKVFLTASRAKQNYFNKSRENSINSSYNSNSKYFKDSVTSNLSCIPLKKSNYIESRILEDESSDKKNEINLSTILNKSLLNNQSALLPLNALNNKKKLISDRLQNFINIKKNLMLKKNKIYKDQKDRLKIMVNICSIEE